MTMSRAAILRYSVHQSIFGVKMALPILIKKIIVAIVVKRY